MNLSELKGHTPGNWGIANAEFVYENGRIHVHVIEDGHFATGPLIAIVARRGVRKEQEANARLIAAAPDLLASNTRLLKRVEDLEAELIAARRFIWLNHGCNGGQYGDDGEMQCCMLDFKRQPLKELIGIIEQRNYDRYCAEQGS